MIAGHLGKTDCNIHMSLLVGLADSFSNQLSQTVERRDTSQRQLLDKDEAILKYYDRNARAGGSPRLNQKHLGDGEPLFARTVDGEYEPLSALDKSKSLMLSPARTRAMKSTGTM